MTEDEKRLAALRDEELRLEEEVLKKQIEEQGGLFPDDQANGPVTLDALLGKYVGDPLLKGAAATGKGIVKSLEYPQGVMSATIAKMLQESRPASYPPVYKEGEITSALLGNKTPTDEYLRRLTGREPTILESLVGGMATDPLTIGTPIAGIPKVGKALSGILPRILRKPVKTVLAPVSTMQEAAGKSIYSIPFRKADIAALETGSKFPSQIAFEQNMVGSTEGILEKLKKFARSELEKRNQQLKQVAKEQVPSEEAVATAWNRLQKQQDFPSYQYFKREVDPLMETLVMPFKEVGSVDPITATLYKTELSNRARDTAYKLGAKPGLEQQVLKDLAAGYQKGVEKAVGSKLGPEELAAFKERNLNIGSIIGPGETGALKQLRAEMGPSISPWEDRLIGASLYTGNPKAAAALGLGKLLQSSKSTLPATLIGKGMTSTARTGAGDALLREIARRVIEQNRSEMQEE